jgi:hypothetical protein
MQLSLQKIILPKEEWVKFEEVSMIWFSKKFMIIQINIHENMVGTK